jgi:hypothetical protein
MHETLFLFCFLIQGSIFGANELELAALLAAA